MFLPPGGAGRLKVCIRNNILPYYIVGEKKSTKNIHVGHDTDNMADVIHSYCIEHSVQVCEPKCA